MRVETFESGIVYLGDCRDILKNLGEGCAEIAVTSPPYNLTTDKSPKGRTRTARGAIKQFEKWYPDRIEETEYRTIQRDVISLLRTRCKSSVFYNHRLRFAWHGRFKHRVPSNLYHPMDWLNEFPVWSEIIWDRGGVSRPQPGRFYVQDERIYQIGRPRKWFDQKLSNIWRIPPSRNDGHPCSFPSSIVENCLLSTTEEGDTIIDPYLGSGTTAASAIKHNRRFIGIELDPKYFDLACKKIEQAEISREMWLF